MPATLATICSLASAIVYAAITFARERDLSIPWRHLPSVLLPGALTTVSFAAYFYSLTRLNAATVALLFATIPLFAMLLATLTGLHHSSWRSWLAAVAGLGGVAMVVLSGSSLTLAHLTGDAAALFAALCAAAYTVALKPLSRRFSPSKLLAYVFTVSGAGTVAIGFHQLQSQHWTHIPVATWPEIIASILLAFIFAESAYIVGVTRAGPVRAALYSYLIPVFGVASAWLLLDARLSAVSLAGGVVIIAALVIGRVRDSA
jgi:drug/metabolite transporter (DMT)-like permease